MADMMIDGVILHFVQDVRCPPDATYLRESEGVKEIVAPNYSVAVLSASHLLKSVAEHG